MTTNRIIALLMRVIGAGGSALLSFVIAKMTNPSFLGEFQYILTITLGLAILARAGLDRGIVRYVARTSLSEERNLLLRFSIIRTLKNSIIIGFLIAVFFLFNMDKGLNNYNSFILIVFPLMALSILFSGYYKGIFKPNISFLYDIGSVSLLASLLIIAACQFNFNIFIIIPWSFIFSYMIVTIFGLCNFINIFSIKNICLTNFTNFKHSSYNFMWMTLCVYLQQLVLVLVISHYLSNYELGLYKIAEKLAFVVGFFQSVVTAIYSPYFSKFYHEQDVKSLKAYARKASNMSLLLSFPSFIIIIIFSQEILKVFGSNYIEASSILIALAVSQFINVIMGPASMILNQTGYEKISKNIIVSFSLLSLPFIVLSCYFYGAFGGSMMILLINFLQNLLYYIYVYKKTGLLIYPKFSLRG